MKFTLATLAAAAIASAAPIQVAVLDSTGTNIGYLKTMFGANFGEAFLDSDASTYELSDTKILTFTPANGNQYALQYLGLAGSSANLVVFSNRYSNPVALNISDDAKIMNYNWWACKSINTPGGLSDSYPEIVGVNSTTTTAPFPNCQKVDLVLTRVPAELKANGSGSVSASASSPQTTLVSSTQASSPTTTATNTFTRISNSAIGTYITWISKATVITVTSCGTSSCSPVKMSVTEDQMVTCDACVLPLQYFLLNNFSGTTVISRGDAGRTFAGAFGAFAMAALLLV
ncbi:hypothetical protein PUMCH_004808 [Australozyma saopauloensis]|uniref:Uncharacterized protein n=1 Tax=Australozyma saopauloensis TaxID=291208 RepID=A0AAX4HG82_9ASCO|nr:hypothetical protein PUMCH_004808 [[Candida] saopauloensis]